MMRLLFVSALAVSFGVGAQPPLAPDHVLEAIPLGARVTHAPPGDRASDIRLWSGRAPMVHSSSVKESPFAVLSLSTESNAYALGERIGYRVLLKNVSQDTLVCPWSLRYELFAPTMSDVRALAVGILVEDPDMGIQQLLSLRVYGSPSIPGTVRQIRPGQTVEIRADAPFALSGGWKRHPEENWIRDIKLKVTVSLLDNAIYFRPAVSDDFPLRVRQR